MKLKRLIKDLPHDAIKGSKDIEITGICSDSRRAQPGDLFIARRGESYDGSEFIPDAISSGAVAVVTDLYDPSYETITQWIHPQPQDLEAILSKRCYEDPSKDLFLVGITGTNGKTTTAYLIKSFLDQMKESTGLLSTVETIIDQTHLPTSHTTLDVVQNHKLLREMKLRGCKSAVLEVTSHGLAQGRVRELDFDVAIFTNLTPEHLDYHASMEDYAAQKQKLFSLLNQSSKEKKLAIINADSPWGSFMKEVCEVPVLTYGIELPADVYATDIEITSEGSRFTLHVQGASVELVLPLIGRFNISNALAAICCVLSKGVNLKDLPKMLRRLPQIPGRLEKIKTDEPIHVFVDFAHTEDALFHSLSCLKELSKARILTVFGCGGNRDREKRPHMAKVVEKFSDLVWVTNDNPRREDPESIVQEIVQGFSSGVKYHVELDRKKAIEEAISLAKPGDIVLIAGRGHEQTQTLAHSIEKLDDREIARKVLKKRCTFC